MAQNTNPAMQLEREIINLRARLEEAEQTLRAIQNGEIDALVISTGQGEKVFTLKGADHPFRVLIENMSEGALTITTKGLILYANQRFAQMLKKPLEKVLGSSLLDWIRPANRRMLQTLLDKDNGRRRLAGLNLIVGNGSLVPAQLSLVNLKLDGAPESICVIVTDLSEHVQQEKALHESEARYRSLVENANEAIIVIKDGIIKYANPMAEQVFSCSADKMTSLPFIEFVYPDDRSLILERTKIRLSKGKPENPFNYRLMDRKGNIKHILENSVKIDWGGSSAILALLTDITEFKKMEEEMLKADKLEAIGILAGGIAHDFNNYLATLLANISLAKIFKNDFAKIEERLANMEKTMLRAKGLANQLFTFAQGGALFKEKISIRQLIMDDIKFALSGSQVRPAIIIDADLHMVDADASQLSQVLNNIAINAVQAMPEGGALQVRAENTTLTDSSIPLPQGSYVKITIRDEGTGIPPKYLPKIFDPFFTTKDKGRGLGLATAYSIIKKHDGYLSVESEMGVGTSFTILLPAIAQTATISKVSDAVFNGKGKILVMDDEEDLLTATGEILTNLGYDVSLSRDGQQALELYTRALEQNQPFNLVILDLTIPGGMGGKQTIKELQKLDPGVKAIVASGYSNDSILVNFSDYGFKAAVKKPFTLEKLSEMVSKVIG